MGIVVFGALSGTGMEVDTDHNAKVSPRAPAFGTTGSTLAKSTGTFGYYRQSVTTGATTSLGTPWLLFSFRWGAANTLALIQSVSVSAMVTTTSANSQQTVPLQMSVARSFTASDSGGTALTPFVATNNQKQRAVMGSSLVTDMRVATTTTMTAGTRTLDTNPIGWVMGNLAASAAAGAYVLNPGTYLYVRDQSDQHPLVLAANEGFVVAGTSNTPATTTIAFTFTVQWGELPAF